MRAQKDTTEAAGLNIASIAFDPGLIAETGLMRSAPEIMQRLIRTWPMKWLFKTLGVTMGSLSFSGAALAELAISPRFAQASGKYIQSNNGRLSRPAEEDRQRQGAPEFTSSATFASADAPRVERPSIAPGKPMQNAFIQRFNGRQQDERLDETPFSTPGRAKAPWAGESDCHESRPCPRLGLQNPAAFAAIFHPRWDSSLRQANGPATGPAPHPAERARSTRRNELAAG